MEFIAHSNAGIAAVCLATVFALPIAAATIPASTTVQCNGGFLTGPVNHSQSCTGRYGETADAEVGGTFASAGGRQAGTANGQGGGNGYANVTYYFDIIATGNFDFNLMVPVEIDALLSTSTAGDPTDFLNQSYAEADLNIRTGNISDYATLSCSGIVAGSDCGNSSTVQVSQILLLFPQSTNQVSLTATFNLSSQLQSSASATADPFIRIDPTFLAEHPEYSLVFSDGVSNGPASASSAPEPAAAWLASFGLLIFIGVVARRTHANHGQPATRLCT